MSRRITRNTVRHMLGRIFDTGAAVTLSLPIYDTQCSAKLFRNSDDLLRSMFSTPFVTNWFFDVELLARYGALCKWKAAIVNSTISELPLRRWEDAPGSKVTPVDFPWSFIERLRVAYRYRSKRWPRVER